jgi:hypothetical protein
MWERAVDERYLSDDSDFVRIDRRFDKKKRPKLGLTLVCLSGLAILWIPVNLYWMAFVPGSFAFAGILFGTLVLSCGVIGWLMPQYVRLLGAFAIILSIASIIGALGGLIIGTLLGIVGGSLCIAWGPTSRPSHEINGQSGGIRSAEREAVATWKKWFK